MFGQSTQKHPVTSENANLLVASNVQTIRLEFRAYRIDEAEEEIYVLHQGTSPLGAGHAICGDSKLNEISSSMPPSPLSILDLVDLIHTK
jgi:hypothetical protein